MLIKHHSVVYAFWKITKYVQKVAIMKKTFKDEKRKRKDLRKHNAANFKKNTFFFFWFIYFLRERERERERKQASKQAGEEQREKENPTQALHCQHRTPRGARTHEP